MEFWVNPRTTFLAVARMKVLLLALLCLLNAVNEAKIFERCELARVMQRYRLAGYNRVGLGNWLCMAYHESRFNTRLVGPKKRDGSRGYGIFQINSRWWCDNGEGVTANRCQTSCNNFINDDITDDIKCVKRISHNYLRMNTW
ncbi:hypothetical protein lerEdw1_010245 [Lerista edwardsae]|nr:hypothetical protein lerEdw1_010245 [Lerista edwardsae]